MDPMPVISSVTAEPSAECTAVVVEPCPLTILVALRRGLPLPSATAASSSGSTVWYLLGGVVRVPALSAEETASSSSRLPPLRLRREERGDDGSCSKGIDGGISESPPGMFMTDDDPELSPNKAILFCEAGLPPARDEPPRNESVLFDNGRD